MGMICIGVGTCTLGRRQTDKDGRVISETPARWEPNTAGECVAVWPVNPDTMQQTGAAEIFGDYDAAGYLAKALELLHQNRRINIPNLEFMIRRAAMDQMDICDYCQNPYMCRDCIVKEWKENPGGE